MLIKYTFFLINLNIEMILISVLLTDYINNIPNLEIGLQ